MGRWRLHGWGKNHDVHSWHRADLERHRHGLTFWCGFHPPWFSFVSLCAPVVTVALFLPLQPGSYYITVYLRVRWTSPSPRPLPPGGQAGATVLKETGLSTSIVTASARCSVVAGALWPGGPLWPFLSLLPLCFPPYVFSSFTLFAFPSLLPPRPPSYSSSPSLYLTLTTSETSHRMTLSPREKAAGRAFSVALFVIINAGVPE